MGAPAPGLLASMTQIHGLAHVTHTAATLSPCSCDSSPEKAAEGFRFDMSSCKDWFAGYLVQKHVCIYIVLYIYIYQRATMFLKQNLREEGVNER